MIYQETFEIFAPTWVAQRGKRKEGILINVNQSPGLVHIRNTPLTWIVTGVIM
jgi:hypothetical protein